MGHEATAGAVAVRAGWQSHPACTLQGCLQQHWPAARNAAPLPRRLGSAPAPPLTLPEGSPSAMISTGGQPVPMVHDALTPSCRPAGGARCMGSEGQGAGCGGTQSAPCRGRWQPPPRGPSSPRRRRRLGRRQPFAGHPLNAHVAQGPSAPRPLALVLYLCPCCPRVCPPACRPPVRPPL